MPRPAAIRLAPAARAALLAPLLLAPLLLAAPPAAAQRYTRPERDWVTFETAHFRFHAPREMEPWTRHVAQRMEAVHAAVGATVGHGSARTDVLVEDPANDANGSAWPLRHPLVFLWPVPPGPRSSIGHTRGWGEILAVHEYAHIAHLTRPSRNRWQRGWRALLPGAPGPIVTRTPRWAIEGYATYVEGALTGSGRPHTAQRAAVLRQWALDGRLPGYAALSGTGGYLGGSFAYLMGSAYLEWLGAQRGDSSITAVWRRLSARRNRSFDAAFAGVYGDEPATLYARFAARTTADAYAVRARLDSAGLASGALYQRLSRQTGDPALSRDGRRLAIELAGAEGEPSRIVLWRVGADAAADTAADSSFAREQRRLLRRDPEDVAAVRAAPLGKTAVATLPAIAGRAHHDPRFLADGRRLLVWRDEPTAEGVFRPDLFEWDVETRALRRVTHGAAVRAADPAPDGRQAAAVRCLDGRCDLVRVDLASGAVTTLAAGSPTVSWDRPRWSPDGSRLVAVVQREGRWRPALVDPRTGAARDVGAADGAERYDATFTPDGTALLLTSERGGIPNLARLDLATGVERPLTRVTGAAYGAEPSAAERAVYHLELTPAGLDVRRLVPDSTPVRGDVVDVLAPPSRLARTPAAALRATVAQRPPVAVDTFAVGPVSASRAYGAGPRRHVVLPWGGLSSDGGQVGLAAVGTDPAGRLTWLLQGARPVTTALARSRAWEGGSLRAAWRGLPVTLTGELFALRQDLGARAPGAGGPVAALLPLDQRWRGATLVAGAERPVAAGALGTAGAAPLVGTLDGRLAARGGASLARLAIADGRMSSPGGGAEERRGDRGLAFAELHGALAGGRGTGRVGAALALHGATGRTAGADWTRGVAAARLLVGRRTRALDLDAAVGATGRDAPAYEQFAVGGASTGLVDDATLAQRIALPALPTGYRVGPRVGLGRAALVLGAVQLHYTTLQAGRTLDGRWARLWGADLRETAPFAPFARIPQARIVAGVARVLDAPLADRTRGYFGLTFTP